MYSYIKGTVTDINGNILTLEAGGIGYELVVSASCLNDIPQMGKDAKIYTHLNVREDGVSLFGFSSKIEKGMFLRLITVSGIGPKIAVSILSNISLSELSTAVAIGDTARLSCVKGIGKKTAERIVLELRDKISEQIAEGTDLKAASVKFAGGGNDDAVTALVSLGYSKSEAVSAVNKYFSEGMTTEALILKVLKG